MSDRAVLTLPDCQHLVVVCLADDISSPDDDARVDCRHRPDKEQAVRCGYL